MFDCVLILFMCERIYVQIDENNNGVFFCLRKIKKDSSNNCDCFLVSLVSDLNTYTCIRKELLYKLTVGEH